MELDKRLLNPIRYDGELTNYKQLCERFIRVEKTVSDNMCEYSRNKFNRQNREEQEEYIKRLGKKRTVYNAFLDKETFLRVPKYVYDWFIWLNGSEYNDNSKGV